MFLGTEYYTLVNGVSHVVLFVFFWFSLLYQVSFAVVVLQLLSVCVVSL